MWCVIFKTDTISSTYFFVSTPTMKKQCLLCDIPDCSLESDEDVRNCPIHKCLSVIGKKRTLIVLLVLERPMRFGELKRAIPDMTEKVLISRLRRLEDV